MIKKTKMLIIVVMLSNTFFAQKKGEIINPKGKWYFGAEIGQNQIKSFELGEPNTSFQAGLQAEYYFARHWSLIGRIKYFETGVSFSNSSISGWLGSESSFGVFKGAVFAIPLTIKWEFRVYKNLGAIIKLGVAYNIETKSEYSNYSTNLTTDYPKEYGSFNAGYGINYFINNKIAVYLDTEFFIGGSKGYQEGLLWNNHYPTQNSLLNFGVKYHFESSHQEKTKLKD